MTEQEQAKHKIRKRFLVGLFSMILWAGIAMMDLIYMGGKDQWSGFEKFRIRMHLEYYTNVSFFIPPIGPLAQIHHTGRFVDAFIDHNMPPTYSMNFVRSLVINSEDCMHQNMKQKYPKVTRRKRQKSHVMFHLGMERVIHLTSKCIQKKLNGQMHSAFFVNGLGLAPSTKDQSPLYIIRDMGPIGDMIAPILINLDKMITNLVKQKIGKVLYINLTDRPETSLFSSASNRMSINTWIEQTKSLQPTRRRTFGSRILVPYIVRLLHNTTIPYRLFTMTKSIRIIGVLLLTLISMFFFAFRGFSKC